METYTYVMALLGGLLMGAAGALLHAERQQEKYCAGCRRRKNGGCACKHKENTREDGKASE